MSQIALGVHRQAGMKKYLEPELKNFRKKTLSAICDTLNLYLTHNNKKQRQIDCIIQKLCDMLNNGKKNGIPEETVIDTVLGKIHNSQQLYPQILRKALLNYVDYTKVQGMQPPPLYIPQKRPIGVGVEDCKEIRPCLCRGEFISATTLTCSTCIQEYHRQCLHVPMSELFECPFCFVRDMDPIHEVVETLFVGYLRAEDTIHNFRFVVNDSDLVNPRHQIQMRCIRLDGKNNYELTWPDYGYVKLNQNKLLQFKPLINNSSLKRRKDEAKVVERKILRINTQNYAQMTIMPPQIKQQVRISQANHLVAVFLVRLLGSSELVNKMKERVISEEQSRQILIQQMSPLDDIIIERLDVSLECVFSMQPINIPARSRECRHFNCFDLAMMVVTTNKSQPRRWRCPICKKKAHHLVVDPILLGIIKNNAPKLLSQVSFMSDQTYKVTQLKIESEVQESEQEKQLKITGPLICLDDEESNNHVQGDRNNAVSNNPTMLDYQPDVHSGLSFEPNPFAIEELGHNSGDKQSQIVVQVAAVGRQVAENGGFINTDNTATMDKRNRQDNVGDTNQQVYTHPGNRTSENLQMLKFQRPLEVGTTCLQPNKSIESLRTCDQTIAAYSEHSALPNILSEIVTAETEKKLLHQYSNKSESERLSEPRTLKMSRSVPNETYADTSKTQRVRPMPFDIITPVQNQPMGPSYPPYPPQSYYMRPPPQQMSGMNMVPPSSQYLPSSPQKNPMYTPYSLPPYFFGMREAQPTGPSPMMHSRNPYEDPQMYMQRPDYSQEYGMHGLPPMNPLSHLSHLQHLSQLSMGPYGSSIPPSAVQSRVPHYPNFNTPIYKMPPHHKAPMTPKQPPNPPVKPPTEQNAKIVQKKLPPTQNKTYVDRMNTHYKAPQMRQIQPTTNGTPKPQPTPVLFKGSMDAPSHSNTSLPVVQKTKQPIVIDDSQDETEDQKNDKREQQQYEKLNKMNLNSLQMYVRLTEREKCSMAQILQGLESGVGDTQSQPQRVV